MVERCELCGARLRDGDQECRECGTPRTDPATPPAADSVSTDPPAPVATGSSSSMSAAASMSFVDIMTPGAEPSGVAAIPPPPEFATTTPSESLVAEAAPAVVATPASGPFDAATAPPGDNLNDPGLSSPTTAVEPIPAGLAEDRRPTAPELQFGDPTPSVSFEDAGSRRTGLWLVVGLLVVGGGVAAFALGGSDTTDPETPVADSDAPAAPVAAAAPAVGSEDCGELSAIAGSWRLTTAVTGAQAVHKLDIHGYYTLDVKIDACVAEGTIVKTGFTGSNFAERHQQRGTATLEPSEAPFAFPFSNRFRLRDSKRRGVDQEFFFEVAGDTLVGLWRQRGSQWDKNGLYGIMLGSRAEVTDPQPPTIEAMSCQGRCAIACDLPRRDSAVDATAMSQCNESCAANPDEPAACGDRLPPNAEYRLALEGPSPTLSGACRGFKCERDPKLGRRGAPKVSAGTGPWKAAHYVHATGKGQSRRGNLRVAVHSDAGWFLSPPLGGEQSPRLADVTRARVAITRMGEAQPSIVTGHYAAEGRHTVFACRLENSTPVCVIARGLARASDMTVIPGGTLAVRSSDTETLYAW